MNISLHNSTYHNWTQNQWMDIMSMNDLNLLLSPPEKSPNFKDFLAIGGMTISCLGIIGNILSVIVLTRKFFHSSTYSYLSALSVCDTVFLIFSAVLLFKDIHYSFGDRDFIYKDEGYYPFIFPYIFPAAFTAQVLSVWLTLAFTVDRYIMICHPFKAPKYCSVKKARITIMILVFLALLFNLPKFFEYETISISLLPPLMNKTQFKVDTTQFGKSALFRQMYHAWLYTALVFVIPVLILATLNSFLIQAVKLSKQRGREINIEEKKRNDTTIMLIGVVCIFFICQMPGLISRIMWAFENDTQAFNTMSLFILNEVANFLIILNSAINILPYYFFGQRFRDHFGLLFCRCFLSKYQNNFYMNTSGVMEKRFSMVSAVGQRKCALNSNESTPFSNNLQIANEQDQQFQCMSYL